MSAQDTRGRAVTHQRVLIADDDVDAAVSLSLFLELRGHTVFTAFGGAKALEVADAMRPDVLILDIAMPALSGYEVARRIRELSWGGHARLIALSGYGQAQDIKRAWVAGFDHHLLKPADPEAINRIVSELKIHTEKIKNNVDSHQSSR